MDILVGILRTGRKLVKESSRRANPQGGWLVAVDTTALRKGEYALPKGVGTAAGTQMGTILRKVSMAAGLGRWGMILRAGDSVVDPPAGRAPIGGAGALPAGAAGRRKGGLGARSGGAGGPSGPLAHCTIFS